MPKENKLMSVAKKIGNVIMAPERNRMKIEEERNRKLHKQVNEPRKPTPKEISKGEYEGGVR